MLSGCITHIAVLSSVPCLWSLPQEHLARATFIEILGLEQLCATSFVVSSSFVIRSVEADRGRSRPCRISTSTLRSRASQGRAF